MSAPRPPTQRGASRRPPHARGPGTASTGTGSPQASPPSPKAASASTCSAPRHRPHPSHQRHDPHPSSSIPPSSEGPAPASLCLGHGSAESRARRHPDDAPHGARRHRRHSHPRRAGSPMPCGQAHRTGSQAGRHPTSTALCGAPHIARLASPRSMRTDHRHAAERHDRERSLAEPPDREERSPKRR